MSKLAKAYCSMNLLQSVAGNENHVFFLNIESAHSKFCQNAPKKIWGDHDIHLIEF
jgi:hypothetical protein